MDRTFLKIVIFSTLIFFFSWLFAFKLGVNQLALQSEDTLPTLFIPISIINDGDIYLDKYYDMFLQNYPHPDDKTFEKGMVPFYLRRAGDHYVSAFPIITALVAVPFYLLPTKLGMAVTLTNVTYLGHIVGAFIVALSGGFLYLLFKKHFALNRNKALLLTIIYLFGTINFAMISQALWQHGVVELFFILAIWFMYEKRWFWMAFMLSLAVISRPTAALAVPFLSLIFLENTWVDLKKFLRPFGSYILGFVPPLAFFTWYTNKFYINFSNNGYANQWFNGWDSKFPEGFLGMWLSPSKGILIYSPIIAFALVGLWIALRNGRWKKNLTYVVFGCILFVQVLVMSIWKHWYGGWSFGYRMAADVIPFMIFLMVPFVQSQYFKRSKKLFYGLLAFSVGVQLFGIVFFDGIWHAAYDDGYIHTQWLWSVRDSEFAFNMRRILVKFGLLDRACPNCLGFYE